MFLVGGGILSHGVPAIHHVVEMVVHPLHGIEAIGGVLASLAQMGLEGILGLVAGGVCVLIWTLIQRIREKSA
jgi:predicted DNA repair protein MutK